MRLLAPIPDPVRNVFAVGWNYVEHFEEGKALRDANQALPEHPVFFTKATHVVNGPYDSIPFDPDVSTSIDWEGELAVVIGRRGRNIPEEKALDFVFGFSVINDTTARDLQQKKHGGQWFKGKSLDGHGPMGPWIVTAAGFDYDNQHLMTRRHRVRAQAAGIPEAGRRDGDRDRRDRRDPEHDSGGLTADCARVSPPERLHLGRPGLWVRIRKVRARLFLLAVLVVAFVAAPAARLVAAAPCPGPARMDCCAGMDDEAAPPCNCSLSPVPPAPAAVDAARAPAIVLAEAPLPAVAAEAPATASPAARIAPRARPAPLFLLFAVFLI